MPGSSLFPRVASDKSEPAETWANRQELVAGWEVTKEEGGRVSGA